MKNIMFKFVKLGITILLLVSLNPQIKAQTVYQKKLIEIKKTYLKEALVVFGQWQEEMNSEIDNFSNNDVEQFLPNIKQGFLQVEDRESVKKTINNLELSVKQANELKSSDIDEKEEKEINKYIEDLKVQIGLSAEMIKQISDEKTNYQKKIVEIEKALIKDICVASKKWNESVETTLNNATENEIDQSLSAFSAGLSTISSDVIVKIVRDFESNIQNFQKIKSTDPLKKDFDDMKERGVNIHLTTLKEYAAKILMMRGDNRAFEFIKQ